MDGSSHREYFFSYPVLCLIWPDAPWAGHVQRLREVHRRLAEGFYDRPDVILQTAERILESGDLPAV